MCQRGSQVVERLFNSGIRREVRNERKCGLGIIRADVGGPQKITDSLSSSIYTVTALAVQEIPLFTRVMLLNHNFVTSPKSYDRRRNASPENPSHLILVRSAYTPTGRPIVPVYVSLLMQLYRCRDIAYSVMEDQNIHNVTTLSKVKSVSKNAPSILPFVGLQMCTEIT